jgi:hypothetical protein
MRTIREFIDSQETVYIIETEEMVLDSLEPEIGREIIGTSNKGVVYEYMHQYGIEKWKDIEDYSLVSIVECYSSERGGEERSKIVCVFDCKTLESTEVDLEIF